jgi:hypothetical protein
MKGQGARPGPDGWAAMIADRQIILKRLSNVNRLLTGNGR